MDIYREPDLWLAAEAGIRAPSMHNSQPWRFRLRDGAIEVLAGPERRAADPTGWAMRIACGAATFNARLALAAAGRPAEVLLRPGDPLVQARLVPGRARAPSYAEKDLFAAVPHRHSNRNPFAPGPVPAEVRIRLIEAARAEHGHLSLLVGMTALTGFAEIAQGADRVLRRDVAYQSELFTWLHADAAPDGVPVTAGGPAADPRDLLPQRPYGLRRRAPGRDFEPEPLIAVLGSRGDRPADQLAAGQALQRVLLTVTGAGLAASLISQPIEVPAAREQLRRSLGSASVPQMAMRVGYGLPGRITPRRPPAEALVD